MTRKEAVAYRVKIEGAAAAMTDDAALTAVELFPLWEEGLAVASGERYRTEDGTLYRCIQAHLTQSNWHPSRAPALWVKVSVLVYPEWVQPTGAHDAYNAGDKCTYQGIRYICTVNENVYAPTVYGWQEVDG